MGRITARLMIRHGFQEASILETMGYGGGPLKRQLDKLRG